MYRITVDNETKEYNHSEFIHKQFTLKAEGKHFTVVFPSGYIALFKPTEE